LEGGGTRSKDSGSSSKIGSNLSSSSMIVDCNGGRYTEEEVSNDRFESTVLGLGDVSQEVVEEKDGFP
jgi:hypothetical protein